MLTWLWMVYFVFVAVLNEYLRREYSFDTWALFKAFGLMPLTILYAVPQMLPFCAAIGWKKPCWRRLPSLSTASAYRRGRGDAGRRGRRSPQDIERPPLRPIRGQRYSNPEAEQSSVP